MDRKQFTTTISAEILGKFRKSCSSNNQKMNDVVESLMLCYVNGNLSVKKEVSFNFEKN